MIWLSTTAGMQEFSIYFEIRDIDIRRTGNATEGVIRGLLGDGRCELWSEVFLGDKPRVQILPEWTEGGEVDELDSSIDESVLKRQLLGAVQEVFDQIGRLTSPALLPSVVLASEVTHKRNKHLAA